MGKISLYYNTVRYMKFSQIYYRLWRKMGKRCRLGVSVCKEYSNIQKVKSSNALDFDPALCFRFNVEELMKNSITILHGSEKTDWRTWIFKDKSELWNYNLHYFEYLFPLVKKWMDTGVSDYLEKTEEMITGWIEENPEGKSPAWASYTISLRIVNWINYYGYVEESLNEGFRDIFLASLYKQYSYLSEHLEKDILGNHYFENLKGIVLAASFFRDIDVLKRALADFKSECKEEILPDGMHFELSPMYHKIILEDMLRVAIALRGIGKQDKEIEGYIQPMLDVAYSFESGIKRIPLFNDGGNNVAKSLDTLVITASQEFGLRPAFKGKLENSGFYLFDRMIGSHRWRLIVDAGQPGPPYIPGHAHCDAMSYELFCDGEPVIVNCGTYAYQCNERNRFRATSSHNTVMVGNTEQSQCWGAFRLAKRSNTRVIEVSDDSIVMELVDQIGQKVKRSIRFSDAISVIDEAEGYRITNFTHIRGNKKAISANCTMENGFMDYAKDFGKKEDVITLKATGLNRIDMKVDINALIEKE